jgi:phosphatidylglycerophosphatase C
LTFTDARPDHKRFGAAPNKKYERTSWFKNPHSVTLMINMGASPSRRQRRPGAPIVAFDFDGTLTFRDSFLAFLHWRGGAARYALGISRLAPAAIVYLFNRDRGRLKAAAAREFLHGVSGEKLIRTCAEFAASPAGRTLIRPDAEQCWAEWRQRGAVMAIVTASPEPVVAPFAEQLGADVLIGTRLQFDAENRVTGAFESENCRGAEKPARLRARFGPDVRLAAAYGDTSGDSEMLAMADVKGYRVFKARRRRYE